MGPRLKAPQLGGPIDDFVVEKPIARDAGERQLWPRVQLDHEAVALAAMIDAAVRGSVTVAAPNVGNQNRRHDLHPIPVAHLKSLQQVAAAIGLGSAETLTVVGRFSKKPQKTPVSPIEVDGVRYLISSYGESRWVKNVRANPRIKLNGIEYHAAEIPVAARKPILDVFKANFARYVDDYFRHLPNDADHPVFSLTPQMAQRG